MIWSRRKKNLVEPCIMAAKLDKTRLASLSEQEQQILAMLVQGMNTSEISKRLSISYREVADMNNLIKIKLDVKSVDELRQVAGQS